NGEAGDWYRLRYDLCLADACAGLMHRALKDAAAFAGARTRGARAVISHQEVRFKLAEMLTLMQTCELLNQRARWMLDTGDHEAATLVGCARVFGAENAERVASDAMQITAGSGYVKGGVSERAYRDAKGLALAGTSVELSRMAIADELLERY
ncbi:MAG: hypothetical protein GXP54_09625, partial [Deltaproteobacteria bacterium]|nr:hypothetical protein [Deltaproteobacteria bacterium]